jgi:hypothetical protein
MSKKHEPAKGSAGVQTPAPKSGARQSARCLRLSLGTPLLGVPIGVDVYARNAYRVLGLPANAATESVVRESGKLKSMSKISAAAARRFWIRHGYAEDFPCEEALQSVAGLNDPRQRLVYDLFWPHVMDGQAERLAQSRSLEDAVLREDLHSQADKGRGRARVLAKHGLAIMYHNLALGGECRALDGVGVGESAYTEIGEHWKRALSLWKETLSSEDFWQYMTERVRAYDDPRVRPEDLPLLRPALWRVLLEFNDHLARFFVEENASRANLHLRLICESSFPSEAVTRVLGDSAKAIANKRLAPAIELARSELGGSQKLNWKEYRTKCDPVLGFANEVLAFLSNEVRLSREVVNLVEFDVFCDVVMNGLSRNIDYSTDRERALLYSMVTTKRLLQFPLSSSARNKLESSLRQDRQHLYDKEFNLPDDVDPTECWFLEGELADPEASILKPVNKITKVTAMDARWSSRNILVPRSALACDLHHGRVPQGGLTARASSPAAMALSGEIDQIQAATATTVAELEVKKKAVRPDVEQQFASQVAEVENKLQQARAAMDPQVAAAREKGEQRKKAERTALDARLKAIQEAHSAELAEAERLLQNISSGAGAGAKKGASKKPMLALASTGAILGGVSGYLLDFWFWLPRSIDTTTAVLGGAALGCVLGSATALLLNGSGLKQAQARVAGVQKRIAAEQESARDASKKAEARIVSEVESSVAGLRSGIGTIEKSMQKIQDSMRVQISGEEANIQSQIDSTKRDCEKKVKKLQDKLAAMVNPRPESIAEKFPAYKDAKSKGFSDGERPDSAMMQSLISQEVDRVLRSLTTQQRMLLQVMLQQAGPNEQAEVFERFMKTFGNS